jgi:hypothetical protein
MVRLVSAYASEPVPSPRAALPAISPPPRIAWAPIVAVAGLVLAVLLLVSGRYGYHRDELYFIQAGGHLALGYPDQPLLTPVLAWTMNALAPRSLLALRAPAALAGVASIVSAALVAREASGGWRAQAIAASSCAAALAVLATSHFLTTETLDLAFSSVACWLLVRLLRTEDERLWVVVGAVLGIGLLNKLLVGVLVAAVIGALLAVGPRLLLRSRWAAAGAVLALLGALPYVVWQLAHGVPQATVAHSQAQGGEEGGRGGFLPFQLALVGPLLVPVWLAGLVALLRAEGWRRYRCFAVAYVALVVIMLATSGKAYYIAGFYPLLLGFGSVRADAWLARGRPVRRWLLTASIALTAAASAFIGLSVLPVRDLGGSIVEKLDSTEGEMVGWPRFVATVASVYHNLPPATRTRTAIFTKNYGEAGAVDLLGPTQGLPQAYSGHNGFSEWGPPPDSDTAAILVGEELDATVAADFRGCAVRAHVNDGLGLNNQEQGVPVWFCATTSRPWSMMWTSLRHYN